MSAGHRRAGPVRRRGSRASRAGNRAACRRRTRPGARRAAPAARRAGRRRRAAACAANAIASGVRICAYSGVMRPVMSMPGPKLGHSCVSSLRSVCGAAETAPTETGKRESRMHTGGWCSASIAELLRQPRACTGMAPVCAVRQPPARRVRARPRDRRSAAARRRRLRRTSGSVSMPVRDPAIDRAHHRAQRRRHDVRVEADAVDGAIARRRAAARRRPPSRPRRRRRRARGSSCTWMSTSSAVAHRLRRTRRPARCRAPCSTRLDARRSRRRAVSCSTVPSAPLCCARWST